jgi:circadian clock protein KaiC
LTRRKASQSSIKKQVEKVPTGIKGLDEITFGGLPQGRPTLVAGGAGSGKTMFAMEFILHGITMYGEPGVYMAFEESRDDLSKNFSSLGFDLEKLIKEKKLVIDFVKIERSEIEETGEYDLEALFLRLGYAIDSIGAKRVALDTLEVLFGGLLNHAILRAELRRLFLWLKDKGMTAVVTGEKGEHSLTRFGLEEYVADCVIFLDNRVNEQTTTRRLRIIKYRGSVHGMDEYPFMIGDCGIVLFPVSSIQADYVVSREHVSTGIPRLDSMLGEKGYYRGSTVLVSGTAGTGKTSFAACYVDAACRRGERCIYFAMEESQDQIIRNMRSFGLDLQQWVDKGLLKFHIARASLFCMEMHLVSMENAVSSFKPRNVVIDPVSNFTNIGSGRETKSLLTRLIDMMKSRHITVLLTELIHGDIRPDRPDAFISSLIDTWVFLRNFEYGGERSRGITILKSRGMGHSNQIREFIITDTGIDFLEPYIGPSGVLMGSAKIMQEAMDQAQILSLKRDIEYREKRLKELRREQKARTNTERAKYSIEEAAMKTELEQARQSLGIMMKDRNMMARIRRRE